MGQGILQEMEAFRDALRQKRIPATRQRLQLAEMVFSTHEHFSAEDLLSWAKKRSKKVGKVTVYRTLKLMLEAGLVEKRNLGGNRAHYEHVIGHKHHDHMVCNQCNRVIEFENRRIEREQEKEAEKYSFEIVNHTHTLFGYCSRCRRTTRKKGGKQNSQGGRPRKRV